MSVSSTVHTGHDAHNSSGDNNDSQPRGRGTVLENYHETNSGTDHGGSRGGKDVVVYGRETCGGTGIDRPESDATGMIEHHSGIEDESEANPEDELNQDAPRCRYHKAVEQLEEFMPHLRNAQWRACRHTRSGYIRSLTISRDGNRQGPWKSFKWSRSNVRAIRELVPPATPNDVDTRVILVEDLSPSLIETLGSLCRIDPQFFEEHLGRSGYRPWSYDDEDPQMWSASPFAPTYASLGWHKPVRRTLGHPANEGERLDLLGSERSGNCIRWRESSHTEHEIRTTTNIFRPEWSLSTDPDKALAAHGGGGWAAWKERATVLRKSFGGCRLLLILLDPLPVLSHTVTYQPLELVRGSIQPGATSTDQSFYVPYIPVSSRDPTLMDTTEVLSADLLARLRSHVHEQRSTAETVRQWMDCNQLCGFDPVLALLKIVHCDMSRLVQIISKALEEITLDSTDDSRMQNRLQHWRSLLSRFLVELPHMQYSLQAFVDFVYEKQAPPHVEEMTVDLAKQLDALVQRTEKCYGSLRADMSILESKRGIAEAESVTKLTELAFIYIPLTFAASCFSMQIEELSSPAPLYAFVAAALIVVALSYSVRLLIRSSWFVHFRMQQFKRIRNHANLPLGRPVPTLAFLGYIVQRPVFLLIVVIAVIAIPIIPLWTTRQRLDTGFKVVITIVFSASSLLCLGPAALGLSDKEETFGRNSRHLLRLIGQRLRRSRTRTAVSV